MPGWTAAGGRDAGEGAWHDGRVYLSGSRSGEKTLLPVVNKTPQTPELLDAEKATRLLSAFRLDGRGPVKRLELKSICCMAAMPLKEPHFGMLPLSCAGVGLSVLV